MIRITTKLAISLIDVIVPLVGKDHPAVKLLTDQIDKPRHFDDMVDIIYNLVNHPNAKLTLNGKIIGQLRNALLSPREVAVLEANLKTWQACGRCGAEIAAGEIASFSGQTPMCYKCVKPVSIMCERCGKLHPIPTGVSRVLTKMTKECSIKPDTTTKIEEVPADVTEWIAAENGIGRPAEVAVPGPPRIIFTPGGAEPTTTTTTAPRTFAAAVAQAEERLFRAQETAQTRQAPWRFAPLLDDEAPF